MNFGILKTYISIGENFMSNKERIKNSDITYIDANGEEQIIPGNKLNDDINVLIFFPYFYRSTLLISICSTFELRLTNLCNRLNLEQNLNKPFKSGQKFLSRVSEYLGDDVGFNLPNSEKIWNKVNDIFKIRNYVVHNHRVIKNTQQELIQIALNARGLTFDPTDVLDELIVNDGFDPFFNNVETLNKAYYDKEKVNIIYFKKDYCPDAIETFEKYFYRLYNLNRNNQQSKIILKELFGVTC